MDEACQRLPASDNGSHIGFLRYHATDISGFTLIPFLMWHHDVDD
jgi:hypothetical protein